MTLNSVLDKLIAFWKNYDSMIISTLLIIFVGLLLVKLLMKFLTKAIKKSKLDPICHRFLLSIVNITLYLIVGIVALSKLNINMSSIVTLLGVAGVAVGLAVQDSLANLAGGFIILFSKPFNVGDYVELDTVSGTVIHINILQTKLLTIDNKAIFIPNGQVSSAKIVNYSSEKTRRLDLTFSIGYKDSIPLAKKIILDIINKNELALKDPAPLVRVSEHGSNSINIVTRVWVKTEDYWNLNFDMLEQVKEEFDKNSITIPYNQLDVYVNNVDDKK